MEYNNINKTHDVRFATIKNNPYKHINDFVKLSQKIQSDAHNAISPIAAELSSKGTLYGSSIDANGNTYDFEIFNDTTYRIISVELLNKNVEEAVNEADSNSNRRYSMAGTVNEQGNGLFNNESDRNGGTSEENVEVSPRQQKQQRNNGYGLSDTEQAKNNRELENSSFSFDNQGRKLSKQQQDFFKDNKAIDRKER